MNATDKDPAFESLLDYFRDTRGFDFTGYKRSSLIRRVMKRMKEVGVAGFSDYVDHLEVHPDEFTILFNTILINVTAFFRDAPAWEYLRREIVPRILDERRKNEPVRVWSAGCASGEEAYTLAMVLAEVMGEEQYRNRVKIYGTDVDEEALAQARHASYGAKEMEQVPDDLKGKYFESLGTRYLFRNDLRRSAIFGRHDLVQDAPISHVDLLLCRNTLMYFNSDAQAHILARFHFALNPKGFLFLGRAEMIVTQSHLFNPMDVRHRIFRKAPGIHLRDRMTAAAQAVEGGAADQLAQYVRMRDAAFDKTPEAQVVVDRSGNLALANEQSRTLFGVNFRDTGRPFQDLELSYRPVELRSLIDKAYAERRPATLLNVKRALAGGDVQHLDIEVKPLLDNGVELLGALIIFTDVTDDQRIRDDLIHSKQELETAYEELQSTNEELETTNEELQSTNEELQTTNEELQSSNEEMETMNEELQSTNEELGALNDQLRKRTAEVNRANTFLDSVLSSVRVGVVVLDQDLKVLLWNRQAEDFWGLRADEIRDSPFLKLDIGLPVRELAEPLKAFVKGSGDQHDTVLDCTNRRGKPIRIHLTLTASLGPKGERQGVVLVMEER
jgi:two-component system CheB/CheR fusion protein